MPLYMLVLYDLALGRGFVARLFSLPGMGFLGQTSFSIFIWQNFMMIIGGIVAYTNRDSTSASFWVAVIGLTVMAMISTYWIEKPIAKRLRRRLQAKGPRRRRYDLTNEKSSGSSSEACLRTRRK